MPTNCSSSHLRTRPQPSCGPASGRHCSAAVRPNPATRPCAASGCCCSAPPSAPLMRSAWTFCASTSRRSISRRTFPPPTPAVWRPCARRRWPKRWNRPMPTRISAPLQTSTARAAATKPPGIPSCTSTIFSAPCPTTTANWMNFWNRGRPGMDSMRPAGTTCCWPRRPALPEPGGSCSAPPGTTAKKTSSWPASRPRIRERPMPPAPRPWQASTINSPNRWNGSKRPLRCWARWSVWPKQGSGPRSTTGSPPMCSAWSRCPA